MQLSPNDADAVTRKIARRACDAVARFCPRALEVLHQSADTLEVDGAGFGRGESSRRALKQPESELLFECGDDPRDRRRVQIAPRRHGGEAAGLENFNENGDGVEVHAAKVGSGTANREALNIPCRQNAASSEGAPSAPRHRDRVAARW